MDFEKELKKIQSFIEQNNLYPEEPESPGKSVEFANTLLGKRKVDKEKEKELEDTINPEVKVDDVQTVSEWLSENGFGSYLNEAILDISLGNIAAEEGISVDSIVETDAIDFNEEDTSIDIDDLSSKYKNKKDVQSFDEHDVIDLFNYVDNLVEEKAADLELDKLLNEVDELLGLNEEDDIFSDIDNLTHMLETSITPELDVIDNLLEQIEEDLEKDEDEDEEDLDYVEDDDVEIISEETEDEEKKEENKEKEKPKEVSEMNDEEAEIKMEKDDREDKKEGEKKAEEAAKKEPEKVIEDDAEGENDEKEEEEEDLENMLDNMDDEEEEEKEKVEEQETPTEEEVAPTEQEVDADAEKAEGAPEPETEKMPIEKMEDKIEEDEKTEVIIANEMMFAYDIARKATNVLMEMQNSKKENKSIEVIKEIVLGKRN